MPWIRDVGEIPLTATTTAVGATTRRPDGSTRMWLVVSGRPAYLAEIDPGTAAVQVVPHPDGDKYWIVGRHLHRSRWY